MSTPPYDINVLHWGYSIDPVAYRSARRHAPAPRTAVQQRQRAVTADYVRRASALDAAHCGTAHGCCNGPASTALASYGGCKGIVFGAFGECSSNADDLIAATADMLAARRWGSMDCANFEHARSVAMWGTRRRWGMTHLREHARLLLNGMQWVGGSGERHHADAQHSPRAACPSYSAYAHGSRHSQRVPVSRA